MKNLIAKISATAMVLTLALASNVSAAGVTVTTDNPTIVNGATEAVTITYTADDAIQIGETVTITAPANWTIADTGDTDIDGTPGVDGAGVVAGQVLTYTTTAITDTAISLVVNVTPATPAADNSIGYFEIGGTAGDYGMFMVAAGNANTVAVTARVVPTLSFAIANGTDGNTVIGLGDLPIVADTYAEDDVQLNYSTNAQGGLTIAMTSNGLVDSSLGRELGVTDIAGAIAQTAAVDYYKVSTVGGTGAVTFTDANVGLANAAGTDMTAGNITVATSAVPVAGGTQMVTVGARAAATTEAGNYADTLTFIATASF